MTSKYLYILILSVSCILFIILMYFVNLEGFHISENTGLYLFSALLQSNAAILSIAGVFFIFRVQNYQSNINTLKNVTIGDPGVHSTPTQITQFDSLSLEEKRTAMESSQYSDFIKELLRDWVKNLDDINVLKRVMKPPVIFISIGLILNTIGLIFSSYIHQSSMKIEIGIIYFTFFYQVLIIVILVKSIFSAFKA